MSKLLQVLVSLLRTRFGMRVGAVVAAGVVAGDADLDDKVIDAAKAYIVNTVQEKTGLALDVEEPWSDASLSEALSERTGIEITSVYNSDVLSRDLSTYGSDVIEVRSGVRLSDLQSTTAIRADLLGHAVGLIASHTGLSLSNIESQTAVEDDVRSFVLDKMESLVADLLRKAADDFGAAEDNVTALLAIALYAMEGKKIRAKDVVLGAASSAVVAAYAHLDGTIAKRVRRFRRQEQNRAAQRRFRERHGNRMQYEPL